MFANYWCGNSVLNEDVCVNQKRSTQTQQKIYRLSKLKQSESEGG